MALEVVVGVPFSGKGRWIAREVERREDAGEIGLVALSYTDLYRAMVPGDQSVYRDGRVADSGAARWVGYVLQVAIAQAAERELSGYVAVDSPRRALAAVEQTGAERVIEVEVTQPEAMRRADEHVELVRELAPRAAADDGKQAAAQCREMVRAYFRERPVLDGANVRKVKAPSVPPAHAITYAYKAAAAARRRGDSAKVRKWLQAAKDWSIAHGLPGAKGIRVPA